jgi:hypothetical protein
MSTDNTSGLPATRPVDLHEVKHNMDGFLQRHGGITNNGDWDDAMGVSRGITVKKRTTVKKKLTAGEIFDYPPNHWKDRISGAKNDNDMLEIIGEYGGICVAIMAEYFTGAKSHNRITKRLLQLMNRHAKWCVPASEGFNNYYRLHKDWLGIILVQTAIASGEACGELEEVKSAMRMVAKSSGWDEEVIFNPTYNDVNIVHKASYSLGDSGAMGGIITGSFNLVFTPIPGIRAPGMMLKSNAGKLWELVDQNPETGNWTLVADEVTESTGKYKTIPLTTAQIQTMEIIQ